VTAAAPVAPNVVPAVSPFYRPCWVEIDPAALRHNWRSLKRLLAPKIAMLAVVKADAYGHGLLECARIAAQEGAVMLGVSSLEEGIRLRQAGLRLPVLVLGTLYPFENFPLLFKHRLTPTIASEEAAAQLNAEARRLGRRMNVHLKIDTGFGRTGVRAGPGGSAVAFIKQVAAMPNLIVEGIFTHFSSADVDPKYTRRQHGFFVNAVGAVSQAGIRPRWIHEANSSALLRFPETHGTLVRPGLAFYGVAPFAAASKKIALVPALSWKSRIIFLKTVPVGFSVSYAATWTAKRPTRVATLAVGYADGYPRLLSNKGQVLLRGRRAPVIGRVTMDMMMVDVTDIPKSDVGDEAVLLGRQGAQDITAGDMADWAQTNSYEILCGIAARVPRVIQHE
jgi:alanine racemase